MTFRLAPGLAFSLCLAATGALFACNGDGLGTPPPTPGDLTTSFGGDDAAPIPVDLADAPDLAASCTDGVQDGVETGVDCGGAECAPCAIGAGCRRDTDCASRRCVAGACASGIDFAGARGIEAAGAATAFAVADFDEDGLPDVAVPTPGMWLMDSPQVALLRGRGHWHFDPSAVALGPDGACNIAAGDFNGDHHADLALLKCPEYNGQQPLFITLWLGDGKGGLRLTDGREAGMCASTAFAVGDVTGDGRLDVVCAGNGHVNVLAGKGDGSLLDLVATPTVTNPAQLALGDLDGDKISEVVVAGDGLAVHRGGLKLAASMVALMDSVNDVGLGDVDGDGHLDAVAASSHSNELVALLGDGMGGLAEALRFSNSANNIDRVLVADLDHDGFADVVSTSYPAMTVNHARKGLAFAATDYAYATFLVGLADFDGDGKLDVGCVNPAGVVDALGLVVFPGLGTAALDAPWFPSTAGEIAAGDFDGDGKPDLVAIDHSYLGSQFENGVDFLHGTGTGFALPVPQFAIAPDYPEMVASADLDRDGKLDAVVANQGHPNANLGVLLGKGDGSFGAPAKPRGYVEWQVPDGWWSVVVADVDGDGKPDLVDADMSSGISVLHGVGDGSFPAGKLTTVPTGCTVDAYAAGDLDGDAARDLVWSCGDGIHLQRMGAGMPPPKRIGQSPALALGIADLDDDGRNDVVALVDGAQFVVRVHLGDGAGGVTGLVDSPRGAPRDPDGPIHFADFDKDGHTDLVFEAAGFAQVYAGTGGGHVAFVGAFGGTRPNRGALAPADFDGDGLTDLAVSGSGVVLLRNRSTH